MLFTGAVASAGLAFAAQFLLTRSMSVADFGRLAALLAVINFLTPVGAAGTNYFLLRAFGREGRAAARWLRPCAILVGLGTCVACLVLLIYGARWSSPGAVGRTEMLTACAPILVGQIFVELASIRFQLEGRFGGLSIWQCVTQTGRFVIALLAIIAHATLPAVMLGYAVVGLISIGVGGSLLAPLRHRYIRLEGHSDADVPLSPELSSRPSWLHAVPHVAPFALMTMFYVIYFQGPVTVLEWFLGGLPAGIYNAAFLIISAISLIPSVIYMRLLLPKLCRWAEHDREVFAAAFHVGLPSMAVLSLICMIGVILTGPWLLPLLFGPAYLAAVNVLIVLSLSIPVRFVQTVFSSLFISERDMVRKSIYLGCSAFVGFCTSVCLVPYYGMLGAAFATVTAELTLLILHVIGTARFIQGISIADALHLRTFRLALNHLMQVHAKA